MCGISILIDQRNKEIDPDILKKINNKIRHRGPDDEGYYYGEQFGFGHRRLSILDLTEAGHQPMSYKGNWITFNGEVYNYIELKNELIELGHHFITATDTEVILAAFDQWGVESFKKMNGMWAFAIFDPHKNEIVICRDHFGIKPLFYTSHDHFFAAGSEIKQFTELPKFSAILNKDIAVDFLATGLLNHTEETFFKGVNELRAGHYLVYNLNSHEITKVNWYNLSEERKDYVESYTDAVNTVEELFRDSIKLRMRSDVTVGSCLSGGIDSSAIVSSIHANKLANNEFATITSCFEDKKFDEQKFSDLIVQSTGFRSCKVYPVLEELFNEKVLDRMVYHHDQPFSSASNYNQFRIFEEARNEGLIVMMDGQGADEYFLGYPEFYTQSLLDALKKIDFRNFFHLINARAKANNSSFLKEFKTLFLNSFYHSSVLRIKKIFARKKYRWLKSKYNSRASTRGQIIKASSVHSLSLKEVTVTNLPALLHSEDRNSMCFSIESRLPFLDYRLVEYVLSLPVSFKLKNGYSKYILREAVKELPSSIKFRTDKMGFVAPTAALMKSNYQLVYKELLESVETFDFLSNKLVEQFTLFVDGKRGYEEIYFRVLTLHRLYKVFNFSQESRQVGDTP